MTQLLFIPRNRATLVTALVIVASTAFGQESKPVVSPFEAKFDSGAIVSLRATQDFRHTEFVQRGKRLGDVLLRFRREKEPWHLANTGSLAGSDRSSLTPNSDGTGFRAGYRVTNDGSDLLQIDIRFNLGTNDARWTLVIRNLANRPLELGDLAIPLPMCRTHSQPTGAILKHGLVSGHGSFFFWMPSDSKGLFLTLTPIDGTSFEYWDAQNRNYSVYIHSKAAGEIATGQGTKWRQPHTSRLLAPLGQAGDAHTYGFKLR
jgi:hypothetical protein